MPSDAAKESWRHTTRYWSYRVLEHVAMAVPERIGRRVATTLAHVAFQRWDKVRATVAGNQARVLGLDPSDEGVQRSTREAFELYARYWYDTFRSRAMTPEAIEAHVNAVGLHHLDAALAQGRGCIAALPHMGNWDAAGRFLAVKGYRAVAVAEKLRPARLAALFVEHRRDLGIEIILLDEKVDVMQRLEQSLRENRIVALLADRDLTGHGVDVEMFGARRRVPAGPAVLALETGAPLIVGCVYTEPVGWRIEVGAPLEVTRSDDRDADVAALSQGVASALERAIAKRPADWHVFQSAFHDLRSRTDGS